MIGQEVVSALGKTKRQVQDIVRSISKEHPDFFKKLNLAGPALPASFEEFNAMIGNPINKNLNKPQPLTPYQLEYFDAIQKYHKVIVRKSRKIGATEVAIRAIAYNVFGRYRGHDVLIIAGNKFDIAREILTRFCELFENKEDGYAFEDIAGIKWKRDDMIKHASISGQNLRVEFHNGTRVFCFAASRSAKSHSFRGLDDVACVFLSEAAHTGLLEDQSIMNALEPILANRDSGDFIMESTPNGRRGFFFNYWTNITEEKMKGWHVLSYDYMLGLQHEVLSKKFIEDEKTNPAIDFDQEYCCKFTGSSNAAFREQDLNYLTKKDPKPIDYLKQIRRRRAS